jgi:hypothetical protein
LSDTDDLLEALAPVVAAFNRLGILHYVGGSVASSYHGAVRSTMDVDLVCHMRASQIPEFMAQIDESFYISEPAVRQAVRNRSCFNLIHLPSSFKIDVFVSRERPFDQACMHRAKIAVLGDESHTILVPIATAEDSIVSKLEWYRLTSETSERQWDDVSRLLRLLGDSADFDYLIDASKSVGVTDLMERLLGRNCSR